MYEHILLVYYLLYQAVYFPASSYLLVVPCVPFLPSLHAIVLALETSCSLALKARIKSFSWSWERAQHPRMPAKSDDQSLEDLCRIGLDALQPGDHLNPNYRQGPIFT